MAGAVKIQGYLMGLVMVLVSLVGLGGKWVGAQHLHHVVGDDRGWDPVSDVASWASRRTFRVGDKIWFAYSAAQGSVAELQSREEYEACDLSNPIRMYTDGLDSVSLEGEGPRFFASSKPENCRGGLKLHVEVLPTSPKNETQIPGVASSEAAAVAKSEVRATAPTTPSGSTRLAGMAYLVVVGIVLCFV
ncbi:mavicyanin-like [Malania oleifera]|uniref:mavicyanin-like n=1 Tax=Malania oleifera TaxID=397392 RepID=UPI0025AE462F|nr:mavicyanin-like [Malania oleifera]